MFNQAPQDYQCVFCKVVQGVENEKIATRQSDIVYRDQEVVSWIASHELQSNLGQVILLPIHHIENIYDLPDSLSASIHRVERLVSTAMLEMYPKCLGTASRLHNGKVPQVTGSGFGQDVFHYHIHILPRYENDNMYGYKEERILVPIDQRTEYAERLKTYLQTHQDLHKN